MIHLYIIVTVRWSNLPNNINICCFLSPLHNNIYCFFTTITKQYILFCITITKQYIFCITITKQYIDTFAVVHALLDHVDVCTRPTRFEISLNLCPAKKCKNFPSIFFLRSHFEIRNNNKPFCLMSQSQSIEWVKQNLDNIKVPNNQNCN